MTTAPATFPLVKLARAAAAYRTKIDRALELEDAGMSRIAARTKTSTRAAWKRVTRAATEAEDAGIDPATIALTIKRETEA